MSIKHLIPNIYLSVSNGNVDLDPIAANYFIHLSNGIHGTATLPDAGVMSGQSLTFVNTASSFESTFSILGPIWISDNSYNLGVPSSVTLLSDGNRWWITSAFSE